MLAYIDGRLSGHVGWYKVVFGLGQVERREAVKFIEDFGSILRLAEYSPTVALLHLRQEPRFQSTYFLSPAAAERFGMLLEKYQAKPVAAPDPLLVYISVGTTESLERLLRH